ncbi:MAG: squalene/phytoene synthase family protein [Pseudomonadota bacterium]
MKFALTSEDWNQLDDRIRRVDEDRWLSARYADHQDRLSLIAFYAFLHELSKVKTTVSEPVLGAMRFQWWRDMLDQISSGGEAPAHDVAQAVFGQFASDEGAIQFLQDLLNGYQDAFEIEDVSAEPVSKALQFGCRILDQAWTAGNVDVIAKIAQHEPVEVKVPEHVRSATAHLRLQRRIKGQGGPVARRLSVSLHILTGRF